MSSCTTNTVASRPTLPARLAMVSLIGLAFAARRQRKALKALEDEALSDLGLTRTEAEAEANKPIWDVPASWRR